MTAREPRRKSRAVPEPFDAREFATWRYGVFVKLFERYFSRPYPAPTARRRVKPFEERFRVRFSMAVAEALRAAGSPGHRFWDEIVAPFGQSIVRISAHRLKEDDRGVCHISREPVDSRDGYDVSIEYLARRPARSIDDDEIDADDADDADAEERAVVKVSKSFVMSRFWMAKLHAWKIATNIDRVMFSDFRKRVAPNADEKSILTALLDFSKSRKYYAMFRESEGKLIDV